MAADQEETKMLNYVINQAEHRTNLRSALDTLAVREPDVEIISQEGRRIFCHRSMLAIFSPLMSEVFKSLPCCGSVATILLPDTTSEVVSHLLNLLYTGTTEVQGGTRVDGLTGESGVFETAKLMGVTIEQKVIEVVERRENIIAEPEEEEVIDNEEMETMEICPQIPMFDLGSLLYSGGQAEEAEEEQQVPAPTPMVENQDYYVCKLPECKSMIMFENCGARSKILNHYTSHFQREIESTYGHLITDQGQCTLCLKDLSGHMKSKVWSHLGVTHDKTNELLEKKGIEQVPANIRMSKRKASSDDIRVDQISPRMEEDQMSNLRGHDMGDYVMVSSNHRSGSGANTCKLCGQVTQNRKRLLKHYCTRHFLDRIGEMEPDFIQRNQCVECGRDFTGGAKKTSKVIHIGVEHKMIFGILEEALGPEGKLSEVVPPPPKKAKIDSHPEFIETSDTRPNSRTEVQSTAVCNLTPSKCAPSVSPTIGSASLGNTPRVMSSVSNEMKEIEAFGKNCIVCGKRFELFRSMLLPHYCGHFYKEIAQGHEDYFTIENCKLCGATATKRKSRIIHLGVKHEMVLPYVQQVAKERDLLGEGWEVWEKFIKEQDIREIDMKKEQEDIPSLPVRVPSMEITHVPPMEITPLKMPDDYKFIKQADDKMINQIDDHSIKQEDEGLIIKTESKFIKQANYPLVKKVDNILIKKADDKLIKQNSFELNDNPQNQTKLSLSVTKPAPPMFVKIKNPLKNPTSEAWITPNKSKDQILQRRITQQKNTENQDRQFHIAEIFKESNSEMPESSPEEEFEDDEDEVTIENLGLVCRICEASEATDHELLTHYCSHFDKELREIAEKMIDEDHKCRECKKMLGNNKRRLYHFGVKHLKVIPMINKVVKINRQKKSATKSANADLVDEVLEEEDDFEITYDDQPAKGPHENIIRSDSKSKDSSVHSETNSKEKAVDSVKETTDILVNKNDISLPSVSGIPVDAFNCSLCEKTTKNQRLLNVHMIAVHYKKDILSRFGNPGNVCEVCGKTLANVDAFAFHLGLDHDLLRLIVENKKLVQDDDEEDDEVGSEYSCFKCHRPLKDKTELYAHLSLNHFAKELKEEYGIQRLCGISGCQNGRVFETGASWISHLGTVHSAVEKYIPEENWLSEQEEEEPPSLTISPEENKTPTTPASSEIVLKCPLKCSTPLRDHHELLEHFKVVHGFNSDIIKRVLKSNPHLGGQTKVIEA